MAERDAIRKRGFDACVIVEKLLANEDIYSGMGVVANAAMLEEFVTECVTQENIEYGIQLNRELLNWAIVLISNRPIFSFLKSVLF